jgi:transcriptional regulator with XRE-family HTH domain
MESRIAVTDPADDYADLGRALAALRHKAGLTQAQAGTAVGVGNKHLSALEQGPRGISLPTLRALLRAYGATLADLAAEIERGEGA